VFQQNNSIRGKLTVVNLATSCLALGLACLGFALYERASFRAEMRNELSTLADTLGANTAASLTFNEPKSAQKVLSALRAESHIVMACLYDNERFLRNTGARVFPRALRCRRGTKTPRNSAPIL
jgi:uncharacterized membrane protein affecting hemolysin expression